MLLELFEKVNQTCGFGIMSEPEHEREELSEVSRLTSDFEVEGGAGKTKTEAPESIRNHLALSES